MHKRATSTTQSSGQQKAVEDKELNERKADFSKRLESYKQKKPWRE